jgi:hypothetical protein
LFFRQSIVNIDPIEVFLAVGAYLWLWSPPLHLHPPPPPPLRTLVAPGPCVRLAGRAMGYLLTFLSLGGRGVGGVGPLGVVQVLTWPKFTVANTEM